MYKLILGLLILALTLAVACGGDDDDAVEDTAVATSAAASAEPTDDSGPAGTEDDTAGTHTSSQLPITVTVTTPDGWFVPGDADLPDLFAVVQTENPLGYIDFLQPTQVYTYSDVAAEVGDPPPDYVQWFSDNPLLSVVATSEVTVGNLQGTRLEITNNDNEDFSLFKMSGDWEYEISYRDHVYASVLDANGSQVVVICGTDNPFSFPDFAETCNEILATAEIGP